MGDDTFQFRRAAQVAVRPARPDDFDQLLSLFEAVAAERQWIGTEPGFDKAQYRATWQGIVDGTNGGAHFVACDGIAAIGALSLYPTAGDEYDLGRVNARRYRLGAGAPRSEIEPWRLSAQ